MKTSTLAKLADQRITGYTDTGDARKIQFHQTAKRQLRKLASIIGLSPTDYDLRTNMAGPACAGEITLHSHTLYIQVSQDIFGQGDDILLRNCDGRKDYTGKHNNFTPVSLLDSPEDFADKIRNLGLI